MTIDELLRTYGKVLVIDAITDAGETAGVCTVRTPAGDLAISDPVLIRAMYDHPTAQSFGDGSYTIGAKISE